MQQARHEFFKETLDGKRTIPAVAALYAQRRGLTSIKSAEQMLRDYRRGIGDIRPGTLWDVAAAICEFGLTWCAGPVALYACREFESLARLVVSAKDHREHRLLYLIKTLPHVFAEQSSYDDRRGRAREEWALSTTTTQWFQDAWDKNLIFDSINSVERAICAQAALSNTNPLPQKTHLFMIALQQLIHSEDAAQLWHRSARLNPSSFDSAQTDSQSLLTLDDRNILLYTLSGMPTRPKDEQ